MVGTTLLRNAAQIKMVDERLGELEKYGIFSTLASLKRAKPANIPYSLITPSGRVDYTFVSGDFSGKEEYPFCVKLEDVPLTSGALIVQSAKSLAFTAVYDGAVPLIMADVMSQRATIEMFGGKGDGVTDNADAFERAIKMLPAGATLRLTEGRTYKTSRSIVLLKPIRIIGGAREQCRIVFAKNGTYVSINPNSKAAVIAPHSNTDNLRGVNGEVITGNATRSVITGITCELEVGSTQKISGLVTTAPIYVYESDFKSFTGDGVFVYAGADQLTKGNANGCSFVNVISQYNDGSGFALTGNDANACFLMGCRSPSNGAWGFFDNSLLGNTYLQCEADNNTVGGYFATNLKPCKSVYVGCYSETPTHFQLGNRCIVLSAQGLGNTDRIGGASAFTGLPSGDTYSNKALVVAETEAIANVMAGPTEPGKVARLSENGLEVKANDSPLMLSLLSNISPNAYELFIGNNPIIRFGKRFVSGNFGVLTPHMPNGFVTGPKARSGIVGAGDAPPTTGNYDVGALWLNESPAIGGYVGWVCTTAGTPGVWRPYGKID